MPFGQAVDAVVEEDDVDVNVTADGVQYVVAANGEAVAVAGDDPDLQVWIGDLQAGGQSGRSTVDAVDAVGVHIVGKSAGAANAGDEDHILFKRILVCQNTLQLGQDGVIAAAGAPAHHLIRNKVFAGIFDFSH